MTTKGEYRVGITFNPSGDDLVTRLKRAAADLIDLIDTIDPSAAGPECLRLKALAQSAIEEGAMWAVKAATKQAINGEVFAAPSDALGANMTDPFVGLVKEALVLLSPQGGPKPHPAVLLQEIIKFLRDRGFKHVTVGDIQAAIDSISNAKGA